jgi:hypothetical protein
MNTSIEVRAGVAKCGEREMRRNRREKLEINKKTVGPQDTYL